MNPVDHEKTFEEVNIVCERALVHLSRMPKIWILTLDFLRSQKRLTKTRRCFDQALQNLPITQHDLIWERYIDFVKVRPSERKKAGAPTRGLTDGQWREQGQQENKREGQKGDRERERGRRSDDEASEVDRQRGWAENASLALFHICV